MFHRLEPAESSRAGLFAYGRGGNGAVVGEDVALECSIKQPLAQSYVPLTADRSRIRTRCDRPTDSPYVRARGVACVFACVWCPFVD